MFLSRPSGLVCLFFWGGGGGGGCLGRVYCAPFLRNLLRLQSDTPATFDVTTISKRLEGLSFSGERSSLCAEQMVKAGMNTGEHFRNLRPNHLHELGIHQFERDAIVNSLRLWTSQPLGFVVIFLNLKRRRIYYICE